MLTPSVQDASPAPRRQFDEPSQPMIDTLSLRIGEEREFLTLRELAALLRVAPVTIYRLVARRALPVYRAFKKILFRVDDVREYLVRQRQDISTALLWP